MWFNRKLTGFQQALEKVEKRLNALIINQQEEKSANDRNLLEFAELGEKMRRTYLRLSRIVKVDSEPSSPEMEPEDNGDPGADARETRDRISQSLNF